MQNKTCRKYGEISQVLVEDSLGLQEISEKFSRNSFFLKFHVRISTEFGTKRDKFQVKRMTIRPRKKSNSFAHKRTFLSALAVMNKKFIVKSCGTNLGLKPQPKLNRHSDECLVKISDQNTQGVRRSKSQTESEQNRFSENKTSWLFFPVSPFCDLFMDVPPYLGANNTRKYLREFFQRNTDPEKNCRKQGEISQVLLEDSLGLHKISEKSSQNGFFLKFHPRISTEFGTKRDKFQVKRMSIHPRKKSNSFHTDEPSFQPWQWRIKNLLPILWDESGDQISAKTQ